MIRLTLRGLFFCSSSSINGDLRDPDTA